MLIHMGLSNALWGEVMSMACFVQNWILAFALNNMAHMKFGTVLN
jgi:hypothetical protein